NPIYHSQYTDIMADDDTSKMSVTNMLSYVGGLLYWNGSKPGDVQSDVEALFAKLYVCSINGMCYPHVIYLLSTCYLLVIYLLSTCYLLVIYMLFTCYLLVIYLLSTLSLPFPLPFFFPLLFFLL